jgi:AbrB family looped-hinge helix DNA binding protein
MGRSGTSKLTSKYQATIPAPIREVLDLHAGDVVVFEVEETLGDMVVRVRKAQPFDAEFAHALEGTLSEWTGPHDEAAYRDL